MIARRTWALAALVAVALSSSLRAAAREPRAGDALADFAFTDFEGHEHHLSDFAGRYVLLDFWATWCQPCLKEVPDLKEASAQFQSRGLVIIGMNSDKKADAARRYIQQHGISWLQSSPESTKEVLKHVLKVPWYPTLILLDPSRKILSVSTGEEAPLYGSRLLEALDQVLPRGPS